MERLGEFFVTKRTSKRPIVGVNPFVAFEKSFVLERLPADATNVRTIETVDELVSCQLLVLHEFFWTNLASVRSFLSVHPLVFV